ncbi:MAG: flavodoxin-dependent (E)-4-hydroxy-3-methylbut-2-enyl-diphosphate synthase [Deltaproteobacteria bacterium]|nr:flavodoxin-dependent (E)-4-hydroxy-3-methylbut-2-enyl-diphosphate synthase [Deltaproteobacteria bacterium]
MIINRNNTIRIYVGNVPIGAGAPISIQSMTNTPTQDVVSTVKQIHRLEEAGCDIVRVGVPDIKSLHVLPRIKEEIHIPIIADIHFDYKIAIGAIEAGVDGIRINPGNIGGPKKLSEVARVAIERQIPIRVGVNLGSIKKVILKRFGPDKVGALIESARQSVSMLEDMGVKSIKVSLKSSDVIETINAYRGFAKISAWPLHIGVTEAGTLFSGAIRSSVALGALLLEGIGDTIRVSLSADPVREVIAGKILLESLGLKNEGIRVIACPMCARANADIASIASEVEEVTSGIKTHMIVAIMGCVVNGPGEARQADIGVACDKDGAVMFAHGKPIERINKSEIVESIIKQIEKESK